MDDPDCTDIHEHLAEVTSGSASSRAAAHLAACAGCARLVARERRLVSLLESMPAPPRAEFGPPALPVRAGGRVLPFGVPAWIGAAAAAAILVAVAWQSAGGGSAHIRIDRVIDVAGAPPPVDERLLALTGGFEAVAMRRPTETR